METVFAEKLIGRKPKGRPGGLPFTRNAGGESVFQTAEVINGLGLATNDQLGIILLDALARALLQVVDQEELPHAVERALGGADLENDVRASGLVC